MTRGDLFLGVGEFGGWNIWLNGGSGFDGGLGGGISSSSSGDGLGAVHDGLLSAAFSARRTISFRALVTTPARVTRSRSEVVSNGSFF